MWNDLGEVSGIQFDGTELVYPNGNKIYCEYDKEWDLYTFDVYDAQGYEIMLGMTILAQAHHVAVNGLEEG